MKILNFLNKNKKNILFVLFFIGLISFNTGFAGNTADPNAADKTLTVIHEILKIIVLIIGLLTQIVGYFLSPGWTTGTDIGFAPKLKDMWLLISNVVYFIFAFLFIWIAFMNIIGKDGEAYQLKQAVPRFIVGVLIVPFSWFIVQFTISVAGIISAAVLSLPFDSFPDFDARMKNVQICSNLESVTENGEFKLECKGDKNTLEDLGITGGGNMYGIMAVYTYGIFGFESILNYTKNDTISISSLPELVGKMGFTLIFLVVYFLLLIALFLALFTRGIYMWLFAVMSPVFGLLFFFKKEGGEGILQKFNFKQFISLALVPVYVSAALAFGLLFIYVAGNGLQGNSQGEQGTAYIGSLKIKPIKDGSDGSVVSFGDMNFTTQIKLLGNDDDAVLSFLGEQAGNLGNAFVILLMQIFGLVILRIGVMAALRSSEITKEITEPIYAFGKSMGELAAKAPTYAPIIPTKDGAMSTAELGAAGGAFKSSIESDFSSRGSRAGQDVAKGFFGVGDEMLNKLDEIARKSYESKDDYRRGLSEALGSVDPDRFNSDPRVRTKLLETIGRLGGSDKLLEELRKAPSAANFGEKLRSSYNKREMWNSDNSSQGARQLFDGKTARQISDMFGSGTTSSSDRDSSSRNQQQDITRNYASDGETNIVNIGSVPFNVENVNNGTGNYRDEIREEIERTMSGVYNKEDLVKALEGARIETSVAEDIADAIEKADKAKDAEDKVLKQDKTT